MLDDLSVLLPTVGAFANLIWLLVNRRQMPPEEPPTASPPALPEPTMAEQTASTSSRRAALIGLWKQVAERRPATITVLAAVAMTGYVLLLVPGPQAASQPGQLGRPFQGLHYVREYQLFHTRALENVAAGAGGLLSLGLLIAARLRPGDPDRARCLTRAGLLVAALCLAGLGQRELRSAGDQSGVGLYLAAGACFVYWAVDSAQRPAGEFLMVSWTRTGEALMVCLALGVTIFARFHELHGIPYGIEGDESKWTIEVIGVMVDGHFPASADLHYATVPVSFFMQAPFHLLFGPSFFIARVEVAAVSVVASLVFYLAARSIANPPVAWLATMLLAVSPLDVSASRLANVESHVKLWPVLSLALLAYATRTGKPLLYVLSGTAVAIGLLTYETVSPMVGVGLLVLLIESVRQRPRAVEIVLRFSAFLGPVLVVAPVVATYQLGRLDYYLTYAHGGDAGDGSRLDRLWSNFEEVLDSLFVAMRGDFLYNRQGPLFNAVLLPWLVLGLVVALIHWRHGWLIWAAVFALLYFLPVPIVTHAPLGRVYYPGLPGAYLLMAIGLYATYRTLIRALGGTLRPLVSMVSIVGLVLVLVGDLYIAFNEVADPPDRLFRRALYDGARAGGDADATVFFPFVPDTADPIEAEQEFAIWLGMRDPETTTGERYPYEVVELASLLPRLASLASSLTVERAVVVWDTTRPPGRAERDAALARLWQCFPAMERVAAPYYDRYVIPADALRQPRCGKWGASAPGNRR